MTFGKVVVDPVVPAPRSVVASEVSGTPWWRAERLAVELADWRLTIELNLAAAVCLVPLIGLRRAEELGVTARLFERPDAQLIYLSALWCADRGELRGDPCADRTSVLAMCCRALRWGGYWDDRAIASERGLAWSERNLVDVVMRSDGPADVVCYAPQLLDLDRRQCVARRCWRRMTDVLDGWGKSELEGPGESHRRSGSSPGRAGCPSSADSHFRGGERLGEGVGGLPSPRGVDCATAGELVAARLAPHPRPLPAAIGPDGQATSQAPPGEGVPTPLDVAV
jgi:hypothetical protein